MQKYLEKIPHATDGDAHSSAKRTASARNTRCPHENKTFLHKVEAERLRHKPLKKRKALDNKDLNQISVPSGFHENMVGEGAHSRGLTNLVPVKDFPAKHMWGHHFGVLTGIYGISNRPG